MSNILTIEKDNRLQGYYPKAIKNLPCKNYYTRRSNMILLNSIEKTKIQIDTWKKEGLSIGFVPTMGFLHEGHISLIEKARRENDKVVVSIFVNPIQFGPKEDLASYPRDIERDSKLCDAAGTDLIFHPSAEDMYTSDFSSYVEVTEITSGLCGEKRPGHFKGVCTVVTKLFNITKADRAYFGEKDAQQLAVIKRMVRDLNMNIEIIPCPIVREADGLAKSSRNTYLSSEERIAALVLSRALTKARECMEEGERNTRVLLDILNNEISAEPLAKIDYIEIVDSLTLRRVEEIRYSVLIALAVYIGKTRLIDNFTFRP